MTLSYRNAIAQLLSLTDFERKVRVGEPPEFHQKRITRLLQYLGNPQDEQNYVHIAGTKGKGSTAAMIAWSLAANGYRTGLFTSPSIHRITERFRINGKPISEDDFALSVENLWHSVERVTADGYIGIVSVFEFQTAMAFHHFAEKQTHINVIEVGLGGRLDSTNVIKPLVSVITPISLDHVDVLGDSIDQIAAEKAGIIKPEVPVVTSIQPLEAFSVIKSRAEAMSSRLIESERTVKILEIVDHGLEGVDVRFERNGVTLEVHIPLLGEHQIENTRTAIATLFELDRTSVPISPIAIASGIGNVKWPARNHLVQKGPIPIFADGAHNDASAQALCKSIRKLFPKRRNLLLILGAVRGHNPAVVARELVNLRPKIILTKSRHPKSMSNSELADVLSESNITVSASTSNVSKALKLARKLAKEGDVILATGSLFVAAEIIEIEHGIEPELYPDIKL